MENPMILGIADLSGDENCGNDQTFCIITCGCEDDCSCDKNTCHRDWPDPDPDCRY